MKIPKNIKLFSLEKAILKEDARICTPKDCILGFLQEMDNDDIKVKDIVISYSTEDDGICFRCAGSGGKTFAIGLLERVKNMLLG